LKTENLVVANNTGALSAMAKRGERLELNTLVMTSRQEGEAKEAGKRIGALARQILKEGKPIKPPCAIIFGGETTVTVKGQGRGGRNQEVALSAAISLKGMHDVAFVSIGSDGIDGNTDVAGAIVDGDTVEHALSMGLLADKFLDENDSNTFLEAEGDCLVHTGPTGINVNDLAVLVLLQ
jgi:glycerate-2-kinase